MRVLGKKIRDGREKGMGFQEKIIKDRERRGFREKVIGGGRRR